LIAWRARRLVHVAQDLAGLTFGPQSDLVTLALSFDVLRLPRIDFEGQRLVPHLFDVIDLVRGIDRSKHLIVMFPTGYRPSLESAD
jgi:hypothetical protein